MAETSETSSSTSRPKTANRKAGKRPKILTTRTGFIMEGRVLYLNIALALTLSAIILLVQIVILAQRDPPPVFVPGRLEDGGIVLNYDVTDPNLVSDAELIAWTGTRLLDMFSFTYANYQKTIDRSQRFSSDNALRPRLNEGHKVSNYGYFNILEDLVYTRQRDLDRDKLIVIAIPQAPPRITDRRALPRFDRLTGRQTRNQDLGPYWWELEFDLSVVMTAAGSIGRIERPYKLYIRVQQVPYADLRREGGAEVIYTRFDPLEITHIGVLSEG